MWLQWSRPNAKGGVIIYVFLIPLGQKWPTNFLISRVLKFGLLVSDIIGQLIFSCRPQSHQIPKLLLRTQNLSLLKLRNRKWQPVRPKKETMVLLLIQASSRFLLITGQVKMIREWVHALKKTEGLFLLALISDPYKVQHVNTVILILSLNCIYLLISVCLPVWK